MFRDDVSGNLEFCQGNVREMSGKCQGILFPLECGNPAQFYHIKVGCKGVSITRTCNPDNYRLRTVRD